MVNQKGVEIGHPSKGRPGRDPDLGRLKSIGPRQMRWDDFSVNFVVVNVIVVVIVIVIVNVVIVV